MSNSLNDPEEILIQLKELKKRFCNFQKVLGHDKVIDMIDKECHLMSEKSEKNIAGDCGYFIFLNSLLEAALNTENVYEFFKTFPPSPDVTGSDKQLKIHITAEKETRWIMVSSSEPKNLHISVFEEEDSQKFIRKLLDLSKFAHQNVYYNQYPKLAVYLPKGVTASLQKLLIRLGFEIRGGQIIPDPECYSESQFTNEIVENHLSFISKNKVELPPEIHPFLQQKSLVPEELVFMDVTALVCCVSNITNISIPFQATFKRENLKKEYEDELRIRAITHMNEFIDGRRIATCSTAWNHFQHLMTTIAGKEEISRAETVFKDIIVFQEDPHPFFSKLTVTSTITRLVKSTFGTSFNLRLPIITSNDRVINILSEYGIHMNHFFHRLRGLSELRTYHE